MINQSIYQELITAGQIVHGYYSDLYTPVNSCTTALIKKHKASASVFINQVEGGSWYDIPFAYEPYWESKARNRCSCYE